MRMPVRRNWGFKSSLRIERAAAVRRQWFEYSVGRHGAPLTEAMARVNRYGRRAAADGGAAEGKGFDISPPDMRLRGQFAGFFLAAQFASIQSLPASQ